MKRTQKTPDWNDDDGIPQFRKLQQEISGQILRGEYRAGDRLPSEAEFGDRFNLSRATVNKAIAELAKHGLVKRNKRAGTIVSREIHEIFMLPLHDISVDVKARDKAYSFDCVLREVVRNGQDGLDWPDAPNNAKILRLNIVHFADSDPVMLEHRYINIAAADGIENKSFAKIPPSKWLLDHVPWTKVRHRIAATCSSKALSRTLKIPEGTPCVVLERSTYFFDQPITATWMTLAGDRLDIAGDYALPTM